MFVFIHIEVTLTSHILYSPLYDVLKRKARLIFAVVGRLFSTPKNEFCFTFKLFGLIFLTVSF